MHTADTSNKAFKRFVDDVQHYGIAFTVIAYVAGILIVNSHLARYGIFNVALLQVQYILAGSAWLILVILSATIVGQVVHSAVSGKGIGRIFGALFWFVAGSLLLVSILGFLSDKDFPTASIVDALLC